MDYDELELLSYEIRDFLVEEVSKTGGHLSSNLGAVELSIALHRSFDTPKDKLIWDVGHQTYVHKILTGRVNEFHTIRQLGGMSGFPKSEESPYDTFDTGHSSTSISLALGLAAARDLTGDDYHIVSVIGDGAMTGGLAFEALNNIENLDTNIIIVLNDNGMSISKNTGGMSKHLSNLRGSRKYLNAKKSIKENVAKVPVIGEGMVSGIQHARDSLKYAVIDDGIIFEEMGVKYFGPVGGHNIEELCSSFEMAKQCQSPVLVHIITEKGKGYGKAEEKPNVFHGIGPFDMDSGKPLKKPCGPTYSEVFGRELMRLAAKDKRIVAVSAAMMEGTGLDGFHKKFPDRSYDVGIAEGHAVTFAAGLAKAGLKPFVAVYSTFLQRAYDQILEDVCLQKLPVVLCIDRAGIVGADGETHHGIFDISYLRHMPNMTILAPRNAAELVKMMELAHSSDGPCAIRYPRGEAPAADSTEPGAGVCPDGCGESCGGAKREEIAIGKAQRLTDGKDVCICALGAMTEKALAAADILKKKGVDTGVIDMRFAKPIDEDILIDAAKGASLIVTAEDNVISGGMGEEINGMIAEAGSGVKTLNIGWPDSFIEHGSCGQLYSRYGMDASGIAERILEKLEKKA